MVIKDYFICVNKGIIRVDMLYFSQILRRDGLFERRVSLDRFSILLEKKKFKFKKNKCLTHFNLLKLVF